MRAPLALVAALVALAIGTPAAGAAPIFASPRPITDVAANGLEVAVLVNCRHVSVVRANGTNRRNLAPASALCGGTPRFRPGPLAFDGFRVAFRWEGGGNNLESQIFVAAAARNARPRSIDSAEEVEGETGSHFDGPRGGAGLIAYLDVADDRTEVRTIVGREFRAIETFDGPADLLAVRGRRIVVRAAGQVRVLDRNGGTLATTTAQGVLAATILGDRVLLLRAKRIDRLNPDGTLGAPIALAGRARAASAFGAVAGKAVYTDAGRVHAVRLADGRDRIVARAPAGPVRGSGLVTADIGASGVVWARNRYCTAPGACRGEVYLVTNVQLAKAFNRRR